MIRKAVCNLDGLLKCHDTHTFANAVYGLKYFKFRVWNAGSRGQIQIVKDNSEMRHLNIYLRNTFETFGPNKTKLQVQGHGVHKYETIQNDFTVSFEKLAQDEKLVILS